MTKRRKPRPRRAATTPTPREAPAARPVRSARVATRAPAGRRPARGARPMFGPPMGSSLAGGLAAVLSTPAVIAFTCIAVLALWLLYSSAGALLVVTAGPTTSMLALPPLSSVLDLQFVLASIRLFDGWTTLGQIVGLVLVRAWVTVVLIRLVLPPAPEDVAGGWRARVRRATRVRPQLFLAMAGLLIFLAAAGSFVSTFSQILGPIGGVGAIAAEMFFLGFTPVVAVTEEQGIVPTLRLGVRAARLHGTGLLVYLLPYVFVSVLLEAPGVRFAHVTLSALEWGLVLIANVLHVIVLGTLANRWLAIREDVIRIESEAAEDRRSRRGVAPSVVRRRRTGSARPSPNGSDAD